MVKSLPPCNEKLAQLSMSLLTGKSKSKSQLVFLLKIQRRLPPTDINITVSTVYQLLLKVWNETFLVFKYWNFLLWIFSGFTWESLITSDMIVHVLADFLLNIAVPLVSLSNRKTRSSALDLQGQFLTEDFNLIEAKYRRSVTGNIFFYKSVLILYALLTKIEIPEKFTF